LKVGTRSDDPLHQNNLGSDPYLGWYCAHFRSHDSFRNPLEVGVFTDPDLQVLYDELVARGSQSLSEAIKAAGALEELDILDLESDLLKTDHADLQQVFNSLMSGLYNHLRAYSAALSQQTGETYQPQHLSLETYQAIIGGSAGSGNGLRGGGNGQQGAGGSCGQGAGGNGQQGGGSGRGYRGGRP
jgi:hypothetical protein